METKLFDSEATQHNTKKKLKKSDSFLVGVMTITLGTLALLEIFKSIL